MTLNQFFTFQDYFAFPSTTNFIPNKEVSYAWTSRILTI